MYRVLEAIVFSLCYVNLYVLLLLLLLLLIVTGDFDALIGKMSMVLWEIWRNEATNVCQESNKTMTLTIIFLSKRDQDETLVRLETETLTPKPQLRLHS